ncbi:hypothetical protein ACFFOM_16000 [Microlunatus capsulatus]|uniref:Uncharacterized protein n=1 Tax=Microlunatus capsulatus TaxID=99117 RepID=A0ABS4ZBA9_9ACTN|nr:hypothetical protein [Microlunatus capsulatus]MBP2418322.1 hypothetical protein [Microlunatus capsulatus]
MSTDTRPPQDPAPRDAAEEPAKPKIELSATQVLAGALAAMTAAYLGSRLSVAGTVVGAAVASVVAAVASSVYSASLRTTQHHVRTVFQGRVGGSAVPAAVETVEDREPTTPAAAPAQPSAPVQEAGAPVGRRPRLSWTNVLVAAVAAFALAGAVLTGVELATGNALSGGEGTTISQVAEPQRRDPQPAASPSASPSDEAPSPTPSASAEPSEQPTPAPSSTPAATPAPTTPAPSSAAPTPESPAPSASSTPEPAPTASAAETPADQG